MGTGAALFVAGLLGLVCGCATVTQEEPSSLSSHGGATANASVPSGSSSNDAPRAPVLALPVAAPTDPDGATRGSSAQPNDSAEDPVAAQAAAGAAAPPSGSNLLQQDFENFDGEASGWSTSEGGDWAVQLDAGRGSHVYAQTETESSEPHLASAGDPGWRDVIVQADLQVLAFNGESSSIMAGLCLRVRDADDFYLIGLRSIDGKIGLRRYANGGTNLVQSDFDTGTTGTWYTLRAEIVGTTLSAYLDDAPLFSTTDAAVANGRIGLCTVRASALFDNVSVRAP